MGTPIRMENTTDFISRHYKTCQRYQWVREVLQNAIEAHAKRVEFGMDWQAVNLEPSVVRHRICDNGDGMSAEQLENYFTSIHKSGKRIYDVNDEDEVLHSNFGIGCRVTLLPWNKYGLVYISYQNGVGSMIWMYFDPEDGYSLYNWETEEAITSVIDPAKYVWNKDEVNWDKVAPDWVREHGTCIVLLGNTATTNTYFDCEDPEKLRNICLYINNRYFDMGDVSVAVKEFNYGKDKRHLFPKSEEESTERTLSEGTSCWMTTRYAYGASYYIKKILSTTKKTGQLKANGILSLESNRLKIHWYLREGDISQRHEYAPEDGFIAVMYKGELYNVTSAKPAFRDFGIIDKVIQDRVFLILEPQIYTDDTQWGVFCDATRSFLLFTNYNNKSEPLPMSVWGEAFLKEMPEEISQAIIEYQKTHEQLEEDLLNGPAGKRLIEKYGERFKNSILAMDPTKKSKTKKDPTDLNVVANTIGTETEEEKKAIDKLIESAFGKSDDSIKSIIRGFIDTGGGFIDTGGGNGKKPNRPTTPPKRILLKKAADTERPNAEPAIEIKIRQDVPQVVIVGKSDMDEPHHICNYNESYRFKDGRIGPAICFNIESPIILDSIKYHQEQHNSLYADGVRKEVLIVYQQVAQLKVLHILRLYRIISKQKVKDEYLTPSALTAALMGFASEEALIAPRLGRFGKKGKIEKEETAQKEVKESKEVVSN